MERSGAETPTWLREVDVALAANPQVAITGNLKDLVLVPGADPRGPASIPTSTTGALVRVLTTAGHRNIVVFDPAEGFATVADDGTAGEIVSAIDSVAGDDTSLTLRLRVVVKLVAESRQPCCLIVEGASRLNPGGAYGAGDEFHSLLIMAEKMLLTAPRRQVPGPHRTPLYNTILWMIDREGDMPHWLIGSELLRVVSIPMPSLHDRQRLIKTLVNSLPNARQIPLDQPPDPQTAKVIDQYASLTSGLTLRSITEVNRLAIDRGIDPSRIDDAIRTFRVGIPENPWHDDSLKVKISQASMNLGRSVLGQPAAIRKAVDILIRSTMGLTGAQTADSGTRPQGVLFFAGPTGVGKTELARAMAELVFGRRDAFLRFDMSEFAHESAEARLLGAPPGYIGHDAGGELTNAVRQQPFRLILFDEVEKAHPRILDKFLQILEDGRLTDGNGSTVYFSESLIVFTSNLGVYQTLADGSRKPRITRGSDYHVVESTIRAAVADHFTLELGRPEILNRIGDNIVVFDYISEPIAEQLVDMFIANTARRVHDVTGARLDVSEAAVATLKSAAVANLDFGGRGVSNVVESMLINPLARAMFELRPTPHTVTVIGILRRDGVWTVRLR